MSTKLESLIVLEKQLMEDLNQYKSQKEARFQELRTQHQIKIQNLKNEILVMKNQFSEEQEGKLQSEIKSIHTFTQKEIEELKSVQLDESFMKAISQIVIS